MKMPSPKQAFAAGALTISAFALATMASLEGTKYHAYLDGAGVPTICTGHTKGVKMGDTATAAQCAAWLKQDVQVAEASVRKCTSAKVTQQQYDALVVFDFNTGHLCGSTLVRKLNAGDCQGAGEEFMRWTKVHKGPIVVIERGLVNRRKIEQGWFVQDCPRT